MSIPKKAYFTWTSGLLYRKQDRFDLERDAIVLGLKYQIYEKREWFYTDFGVLIEGPEDHVDRYQKIWAKKEK